MRKTTIRGKLVRKSVSRRVYQAVGMLIQQAFIKQIAESSETQMKVLLDRFVSTGLPALLTS